jgi:hypothetical protein
MASGGFEKDILKGFLQPQTIKGRLVEHLRNCLNVLCPARAPNKSAIEELMEIEK